MAVNHPLHRVVADEIARGLGENAELLRDPACGGTQHLPLFMGVQRSRGTRICVVDALVLIDGQVRVIVEIEESGFLPTKICGKFLTSALASHFIHDSRPEQTVPFGDRVLFVQILDGSKCLKIGTQKDEQAKRIKKRLRKIARMKGSAVTDYQLFIPRGPGDHDVLAKVRDCVQKALR